MDADRRRLDSLTKYPSIPTWHVLDGKGTLSDQTSEVAPDTEFMLTEKVDGTNGRIVRLGTNWWIGSRDNLLARDDGMLFPGPQCPLEQKLVDTLRPIAERIAGRDHVSIWFFEVFGHGIGSGAKEYATSSDSVACRLFDHATVPNSAEILASWTPERISSWRKRGGQAFSHVDELVTQLSGLVEVVPYLSATPVKASELPQRLEDGRPFIERWVGATTRCKLDGSALGRTEGIVVRTKDRSAIFKLRLEDYDKAMRKRYPGYTPERHAEFV